MDKEAVIDKLREIVGSYLESQNLELIDLTLRYEGSNLFLKVIADTPEGGINLETCAKANNAISAILDEQDILKDRYVLEISSPGLDRPLFTRSDFSRCKNRMVKFFLKEAVDGRIEWDGMVKEVRDEAVLIDVKGSVLEIPLSKINKGKQIIED